LLDEKTQSEPEAEPREKTEAKEKPKGKPVVKGQAKAKVVNGAHSVAVSPWSKGKHKVQFKAVEAFGQHLTASHDHETGKVNPNYAKIKADGALQMRDRSSVQSLSQVNQMASEIEPHFLGHSANTTDGAPIVGSDYQGHAGKHMVESGNGRVMALQQAYKQGKAEHYKQHLIDNAASFGLDPEELKGMKTPVLVRARTSSLSDQQKAKFAKEANKSSVSALTAHEQAQEDSIFLQSIDNLVPTEDGRITNKNNSSFVQSFFTQVMDDDQREISRYTNKEGKLTDEGERRITNAVFVKVYGEGPEIFNPVGPLPI